MNNTLVFHNNNTSLLWDLACQIKNKYNVLIVANNRTKISKIVFLINKLFPFFNERSLADLEANLSRESSVFVGLGQDNNLKIKVLFRDNLFYMAVGYSPEILGSNADYSVPRGCEFGYFYGYFSPLIMPAEFIQLFRNCNIFSKLYHISTSKNNFRNRELFINNQLLSLLKLHDITLKLNDKCKDLELKIILEEYKRFKINKLNLIPELNFQEYNQFSKTKNNISQERKLQVKRYFLADSYGIKQSDITTDFIEKYEKYVPQFKGVCHAFQFKNNAENFLEDLRNKIMLNSSASQWGSRGGGINKILKREYEKRLISTEILDILGFKNGIFDPGKIPKDYFFMRFDGLLEYLIVKSDRIDNIFQNYHPIKWGEKMREWESEKSKIIKSMLIYVNSKLNAAFKVKIIHNNVRDKYRHYFISGLEFWNEIKIF